MKNLFSQFRLTTDTQAIRRTIEQALASAGLVAAPTHNPRPPTPTPRTPEEASAGNEVIDVLARVVETPGAMAPSAGAAPRSAPETPSETARGAPPSGRFNRFVFEGPEGRCDYLLYVPAAQPTGLRPLLVMLHGCTQSGDDFATGTQMNRLAEAEGVCVVYPEQSAGANTSKCWNWFKRQDQRRGAGEPALLAALVQHIAGQHPVDSSRIFVAGLSAGGAMALVLGEAYPEVFAGVGVHSGLPYASAHNMSTALAAMKGGRGGLPGMRAVAHPGAGVQQTVPLIVFHGDRDPTVQPSNAQEIVRQATQAHGDPLTSHEEEGCTAQGRRYRRTVLKDADGHPHIEHWTLHGAGHAWSGGDPRGTYTDAAGPDASAQMLRFFLALPRTDRR